MNTYARRSGILLIALVSALVVAVLLGAISFLEQERSYRVEYVDTPPTTADLPAGGAGLLGSATDQPVFRTYTR